MIQSRYGGCTGIIHRNNKPVKHYELNASIALSKTSEGVDERRTEMWIWKNHSYSD